MQNIIIHIIATIAISSYANGTTLSFNSDNQVQWIGKKLTGSHSGTIKLKQGTIDIQNKKIVGGKFIIDMSTISCVDIQNAEYNQKLVNHLKDKDFFNVQEFPESTFIFKKATGKNDQLQISGVLEIKGKTYPANIDAKLENQKFSGKLIFDRTKWGIEYHSGSIIDPKTLGNKLIYDDVQLNFELIATRIIN
ncbi:MAG: lipid-binding protein [Zetaproteobacteria bacterium]|nr:lipid-binding protein [Pseudobdellovibrionaceae bacterium]|tara:strand:- start:1386 stop:1964 length:579 start_codon:yes stop_codon:yes gene_type:complete